MPDVVNPLQPVYDALVQVRVVKRPSVKGEARYRIRYWFDGKRYEVFSDADGDPLASEAKALKLAALIDEEIERKAHNPRKYQPRHKNEWAFSKQAIKWLNAKMTVVSPATARRYSLVVHQTLLPHFGLIDITEIKKLHIDDLNSRLAGKMSPKSRKCALDTLKTFLNHCVDSEILVRCPPMPSVVVPEKPVVWADYDTQNRILEHVPGSHKAIVHFAMRHGMRSGEVLGLQVGDIDHKAGTITVQRQITGGVIRTTKTARVRILPLHPELSPVLSGLCANRLPAAFLFEINGRAYTEQRLYKVTKRAAKTAGLKITPYQLFRHSVITQAASRGVAPEKIAKFAGHTSMKTTERYTNKNVISIAEVLTEAKKVVAIQPHASPIDKFCMGK